MPTADHNPSEPWERRADESDQAWEAFATYRDLPPKNRTLAEVARRLGKSRQLMIRWSQKYAWQLRGSAYDREQDRSWIAQTSVLRREAAERDARIASAMLGKVVERLRNLDASTLSARDCATWVDVATKVARLALGDPTERHEHSGPGGGAIPVEHMTPEERRARLEQLTHEAQRRLTLVPAAG